MLSKNEIRMFEKLQFFDRYGHLPFERKRIDITLSHKSIQKLKKIKKKTGKPISRIIEELI